MKPKHMVLAATALVLSSANFSAFAWWGSDEIKGKGPVTEQSQPLDGDVDEVSIAIPAKVTVMPGDGKISIKAEESLQPYIEVKVEGDELKVRTKRGYDLDPNKTIEVHISVKALSELSLAGRGEAKVGDFKGDDLKLDLAGATDLTMSSAQYKHIKADIAGSGSVVIAGGSADKLSVDIAGSGDVDVGKVQGRQADIDIAGSGSVVVRASEQLDIDIAGSGDVDYYGNPHLKQSIMGSGDIARKGD
ncbi:DUF2807 domain-containing protein [Gallaecimonas kandeliae]|uniref:head GIN domain-containing protein n=1 Tax=Gallaecimonas kandeliae TaxID=3029055 RepID=UPI0026486C56|nr:head GIN domain-containing protein [Gallaecimonas kandeliae]WKE65405.1 DUF2807 domain-containing protein [Gallaecimonas kandeliae]